MPYYALVLYPKSGQSQKRKELNQGKIYFSGRRNDITPDNYSSFVGGNGTNPAYADWVYDRMSGLLSTGSAKNLFKSFQIAVKPVYCDNIINRGKKVGYLY
jgi:hypothetical protein